MNYWKVTLGMNILLATQAAPGHYIFSLTQQTNFDKTSTLDTVYPLAGVRGGKKGRKRTSL